MIIIPIAKKEAIIIWRIMEELNINIKMIYPVYTVEVICSVTI